MRLGPMVIFLFVLYLSIGIFDQVLDKDLNAYGNSASNFAFAVILQPQNWSGTSQFLGFQVSNLLLIFTSALVVTAGITLSTFLVTKSDLSLLFGLFIMFASLGVVPIGMLYTFVTKNVALYGCTIGETCIEAQMVGALTAGILAIMWLFTCVEWWAWRPTTQ